MLKSNWLFVGAHLPPDVVDKLDAIATLKITTRAAILRELVIVLVRHHERIGTFTREVPK